MPKFRQILNAYSIALSHSSLYTTFMINDLMIINATVQELKQKLIGERIEKITQPENDEIRFLTRGKNKNQTLLLCTNANFPRVHLTKTKKSSPQTAPNFCMVLRKYINGARFLDISIFNKDRIVCIELLSKTEMQDEKICKVYIEIMNRYSNIILTDESDKIIDSLKKIPLSLSGNKRIVMKGARYLPPEKNKKCVFDIALDDLNEFDNASISKFLLDNFSGLSKTTALEIENFANTKSNINEKTNLIETVQKFYNIVDTTNFTPCIQNGNAFPTKYKTIDCEPLQFDSLSEAIDATTQRADNNLRLNAKIKNYKNIVKNLISRYEKLIAEDERKIENSSKMENEKLIGELLTTNLYKIKKGDKIVEVLNYYNNENIKIELFEELSPSKNANLHFDKYNKLKRTKDFVEKKLVKDKLKLDYVLSIQKNLELLEIDDSLTDIENELKSLNAIKSKSYSKKKKEKQQSPLIYNFNGYKILRGKNNIQNEEITFKVANTKDIWLHLKNFHGSHTVILLENKPLTQEVLRFAAEITASTQSADSEIDYTERKFVKRMPHGNLGQVIYTNYKTIVAEPNKHEENIL